MPNCQLDNEIFTCMECKEKFDITQGTFPEYGFEGEMVMENNTRIHSEFVCYDCCD